MRAPLALVLCLLGPSSAFGCGGGQSGTESGGGKIADPAPDMMWEITQLAAGCGCFLADTGRAVRATVTELDDCSARARVVEALGAGAEPEGPELAADDEIGGTLLMPCSAGLSLAVGDDVLIIHRPGGEATYDCPELHACFEDCRPPAIRSDGSADPREQADYDRCLARCMPDTAEMCSAHASYAQLHGELLVMPWADTLHVSSEPGAELTLPREQLELLLDFGECNQALYPPSDAGAAGPAAGGPFDAELGGDAGAEDAPACGAQ